MLRILFVLGVFLVSTFVGWMATNEAIPRVIMSKAMSAMAETGDGVNSMTARPPTDPFKPSIVRPSPDLLYSTCVFDLSDGRVAVRIGETDGYLSIGFFDTVTNNFKTFTSDDLDSADDLMVISNANDDPLPASPNILPVSSPTARGVALIRRRISNDDRLAEMQKAQAQDECFPFEG